MGRGCTPVCCKSGWQVVSETSGNGECVWVRVSCGESADDGGKVGLAHREVSGEGLAEAIVELSLNESKESGRHVFLQRCL